MGNIIAILEELGKALIDKDSTITIQEFEIKQLKKQIEAIEKREENYEYK